MRKLLAGAIATAVLVIAGFGIAYATIPSADGIIHGCYKNSTGDLRVIDGDTSSCPSGYTPLNWQQSSSTGTPERVSNTVTFPYVEPDGYVQESVLAVCPSGKQVISGGFKVGYGPAYYPPDLLVASDVDLVANGWEVIVTYYTGRGPIQVTAVAICV